MNALSDYLMKSGREEAGVLLGAYRVRVVSINQDAFMHRFQHDVVEDFSECLQLLQHVHRPPFSICTPAGISRSLSRPIPAQRSQMLIQPRSFTSPSR